jgi:hypothetical protein
MVGGPQTGKSRHKDKVCVLHPIDQSSVQMTAGHPQYVQPSIEGKHESKSANQQPLR